jgi:antirestriction protein ArdC
VLREDNRAVVRAASAALKAADFILVFQPGTPKLVLRSITDDDQELA